MRSTILIIVFSVVFIVLNFRFFSVACTRSGDYALIELEVEKIHQGFYPLSGAYSRFKIHHISPALFYYYAVTEHMLPFLKSVRGKHLFAQLLLNIFFLYFAIKITKEVFSGEIFGTTLLFLSLWIFLSLGKHIFFNTWNPVVVVVPMLAFALAALGVAFGYIKYLPLLFFTAIVAAGSHLGALVPCLAIVLTSIFLYIINHNSRNASSAQKRISIILSSVLVISLLLPVLLDLFYNGFSSNITRIFKFSLRQGQGHTFSESVSYIASFYYLPFRQVMPFASSPTVRVTVFIALLFLPWTALKKLSKEAVYLNIILLLGIAAAVFSATRMPGKLYHYLSWYNFSFASLLYLSIIISPITIFKEFKISKFAVRIINTKLATALLCFAVTLVVYTKYQNAPKECSDLQARFLSFVGKKKNIQTQLVLKDADSWKVAAPLALSMLREKIDFCISRGWGFMFGREFACTGKSGARATRLGKEKLVFYKRNEYNLAREGDKLLLKKWIILKKTTELINDN